MTMKWPGIFQHRIFSSLLILLLGVLLGWIFFRNSGGHAPMSPGDLKASLSEADAIYTCSMHPQIRQNEPGKCPICGMELIPMKSAGAASQGSGEKPRGPYLHTMSPEAVALANVQTARVDSVDSDQELSLSGRITVNEQNLAVITANFSGRIEKLFIDFTGQPVKKGQRLATLYSPDLITAQKELLEAGRNKESNPTLYRAVREKLKLWKISDAQIASIEAAGEVRQQIDIHADVAGIVLKRGFSTGDFVSKGNTLFEIADLTQVWVMLDAYESDLAQIQIGDRVAFTVASMPGREFTSTVSFVDPVVNPQTRTASVRAEMANPGFILKPDMFVNAKVRSGMPSRAASAHPKRVLQVPKSAVLWTGERSVVYVEASMNGLPAFEMREVTLGPRAGAFYHIIEGLKPGEKVVVNGVFSIDASAQLSGNYSMMNKSSGPARRVPEAFTSQLTSLVNAYLELKNALVQSHAESTRAAAQQFASALGKVEAGSLKGELVATWKKQERPIRLATDKLATGKDLDSHRAHFKELSDALIPAVEYFGVEGSQLYLNYCPMASSSQGAYWLSESESIKNPYYGESMLNCGEVKRTFSPVESSVGSESVGARTPAVHRH